MELLKNFDDINLIYDNFEGNFVDIFFVFDFMEFFDLFV